MERKWVVEWLNLLGLLAVVVITGAAFAFQLYYHELPCPLCMLQRLGFLLIGFGFLLNFCYGFKTSHYGISLLGALFMIGVAVRQILLHILPGDAGFGSPLLDLHLYTWVAIFGFLGIFYIAVILLVQNTLPVFYFERSDGWKIFVKVACYALLLLTFLNVISVFMICGIGVCPDNPVHYLY